MYLVQLLLISMWANPEALTAKLILSCKYMLSGSLIDHQIKHTTKWLTLCGLVMHIYMHCLTYLPVKKMAAISQTTKDSKNFIQENTFIYIHSKWSGLIGLRPMPSGHTMQQQCHHHTETTPLRRFYETTSRRHPDNFRYGFVNEKLCILISISQMFVPKGHLSSMV